MSAEPIRCEDCGNLRHQLREGVSVTLGGVERYICPACAIRYGDERALLERLRSAQTSVKKPGVR